MNKSGVKSALFVLSLKNPLQELKKYFLGGDDMKNPLNTWKAKLERTYYFRFRSGKIAMYYNYQKKNLLF